jgi:hypothetical protein
MKTIFYRAMPVLLAMSLWLLGNILMTTKPVRGQEVTGVTTCTSYNVVSHIESCGLTPGPACSGSITENHFESSCQGDTGDPQHACFPVTGPTATTQFTVVGNCDLVKVPYFHCVPDPLNQIIMTSTLSGIPQCATSNPPPGVV